MVEKSEAGKVAVGAGIGAGAGVLFADLLRPQKAAAAGAQGIDYTATLQALKSGQDDLYTRLGVMGGQFDQIIALLTGMAPSARPRRADKFGHDNQIIPPGQQFSVLNEGTGVGSLVWLLIDTQSPNVIVSIILDNLQYDFNMAQMILEGIMFPTYPGAWITRADPVGPPPTFCMMFSIGDLAGYDYKQKINISVTNNNLVPMTMNHDYGIKWIYQ